MITQTTLYCHESVTPPEESPLEMEDLRIGRVGESQGQEGIDGLQTGRPMGVGGRWGWDSVPVPPPPGAPPLLLPLTALPPGAQQPTPQLQRVTEFNECVCVCGRAGGHV